MPASEDFTPLDTLKRYLSAPRRMVDEGLSQLSSLPQRAFQASEQMRTEGPYDPAPAVEAALMTMGTGAIAGAPVRAGETALGAGPIRAYHSSPHDFDKFDLSKIGTGEGAQVYGHGLYFAENPAVSGQGGQYYNQFMPRFAGPERTAATELQLSKFDREKAMKNLSDEVNRLIDRGDSPGVIANRTKALQLLESGKPVGPRTYEVNINADPAHMLNWDKPLSKQSEQVRAALPDIVAKEAEYKARYPHSPMGDPFGSNIYESSLLVPGSSRNRVAATAALQERGIPGIRYLDQGSRGKGTGSSNYVVFNPSILDIVKKYGLAGLASAPALTSGLRDRENQP